MNLIKNIKNIIVGGILYTSYHLAEMIKKNNKNMF